MKSRLVILFFILFVVSGSLLLDGCRKTPEFSPKRFSFPIPPGFPQATYPFSTNPLTEEGFQLGKRLFFDQHLSGDGHVSCGSCHQPLAAFTTFEHDRSHGANNTHTLRNAPGLSNLAWYKTFTQDGSAPSLPAVYRAHFTSPTEMATTLASVMEKVHTEEYKILFRNAFGDVRITEERIYKALDQYVVSLVSAGSKYDRVKNGEASFNAQESAGYILFKANCATCHTEPLFTDFSFRNTGLGVDPALSDFGRMRVTGHAVDSLKFRVPSLRNAEVTSYYSHDGRMSVFRMMLQHYRTHIQRSATLDPLLTNGIPLTPTEEDQLVAFIRTLTDTAFIKNPRFRD